jgi:hypothetical protein
MFGTPVQGVKSLEGVGSPRWKQRALYDAMRDLAAVSGVVKLARVAVFDGVDSAPLGLQRRDSWPCGGHACSAGVIVLLTRINMGVVRIGPPSDSPVEQLLCRCPFAALKAVAAQRLAANQAVPLGR